MEGDTIFHEGKHFVRVSHVVKDEEQFKFVKKDVLQKKQIMGTKIHEGIEDFQKNEFPILNSITAHYFSSFKLWNDYLKPTILCQEKRFFCHQHLFTGKPDNIVQFEHEPFPAVVDFKACAQEADSWVLQGHLYHFLARQDFSRLSDTIYFIRLKPNGSLPKVYTYKLSFKTEQECLKKVEKYWEEKKDWTKC